MITRNAINSPSCKDVLINGEERKLIIDSGTQPFYKTAKSLPNELLHAGDLIKWNDTYWLTMSADFDNEIYVNAKLEQCNYILKWQSQNGDIIERHVVKSNASAYNNGLEGNALLRVPNDQALVYITLDEETINVKLGQRFFIDNNKGTPSPYELTRIDNVSHAYNGHGCISFILTETQLTQYDNVELGVCDYYHKRIKDDNDVYKSLIKYSTLYVRDGFKLGSTFKAEFYKENVLVNKSPKWNIISNFTDRLIIVENENENEIHISTDDVTLINKVFTLELSDFNDKYTRDTINIKIVPFY